MSHTQEPWFLNEKGFSNKGLWSAPTVYAADEELRYVAVCACADEMNFYSATDNAANARRIVACVNACEGIPTDMLERAPKSIQGLTDLIDQRDKLLATLKEMRDEYKRLPHSLGYDFTHLPKIDALIEKVEASK